MDLINLIDLPTLGDERGGLIALESNDSVPFEIKRVYYIIDTKKGISRGFHAHKKLKQLVICVSGSCQFVLDDGINRCIDWIKKDLSLFSKKDENFIRKK